MDFGRRVKVMRAARSWSQTSLAYVVEIHRTYLSSIEQGTLLATEDMQARIRAALAPWGEAEDAALEVLGESD